MAQNQTGTPNFLFSIFLLVSLSLFCRELIIIIVIAPNSAARKGGKKRGELKREYERIRGEEEGND